MSIEYITLDEAKEFCRIDYSDQDQLIQLLIRAASGAVKNYLGNFSVYEPQRNDDEDPYLDSNYEPEILINSEDEKSVRYEVKLAVLSLVANKFMDPEGSKWNYGQGFLPYDVQAILYPLRDPALA